MKVLLICPTWFKLPIKRYGGIEALAWDYGVTLALYGFDVYVAAPKGSKAPEGCKLVETVDLAFHKGFGVAEEMAYQWYLPVLKGMDVVLDFSHGKYASFQNPSLASLNVLWFEPVWFTEQRGTPFPVPHNPVVFSKFQQKQFRRVYDREAWFQPTICRSAEEYKPTNERNDRFIFIGKLSWHKGALDVIKFCKELDVSLDILGGLGVGDPPYYREEVIAACDDQQICFYPNVTNEVKRELLQRAKALLYYSNFPESHSMTVTEALLCGVPAVVRDIGAMNEVVDNGVMGGVAKDEADFKRCMMDIDTLDRGKIREEAVKKYDCKAVVQAWIPLIQKVAGELRW